MSVLAAIGALLTNKVFWIGFVSATILFSPAIAIGLPFLVMGVLYKP